MRTPQGDLKEAWRLQRCGHRAFPCEPVQRCRLCDMNRVAVGIVLAVGAFGQSPDRFAPNKMETVLFGVAYYPEYMPQERLERDVELMQKAGINVVRVGESTWSTWEPRDGDFRFEWMERLLDR